MSTAVDAVVFDIDGTICEYRRGTRELLSLAFERAGVEQFFPAEEYMSRFEEFIDGSGDMQELRERIFAAIASDHGKDPELGRDVARAYAAERDHSNVRFRDGAERTLGALAGEYRLAAVTNGAPSMQSTKLDALGIDCFETVVYAGYDTAAKPDPEPFHVALDALGTSPERAVYVGNSIEPDVTGAHAAGMSVALVDDGDGDWIDTGKSTDSARTPEVVLSSLDDLPGKLPDL